MNALFQIDNHYRTLFEYFHNLPTDCSDDWDHKPPPGSLAKCALKKGYFTNDWRKKPFLSPFLDPANAIHLPDSSNPQNFDMQSMSPEVMGQILKRMNVVAQFIAEALGTVVRANILRSTTDGKLYLFTYFQDFPASVVGGRSKIDEELINNPPLDRVFTSWRGGFLDSLKRLVPPPILQKIKKIIDTDKNSRFIEVFFKSDDFLSMMGWMKGLKTNPQFGSLFTVGPNEYNQKDKEMKETRRMMCAVMEEEARRFWSYEKIGFYLKK